MATMCGGHGRRWEPIFRESGFSAAALLCLTVSLETERARSGKYYSSLEGMQEGKQLLFLPNGCGGQ